MITLEDKLKTLNLYNLKQLKAICKDAHIIGISKLKKADLIDIMLNAVGLEHIYPIDLADINPPPMIETEPLPSPPPELFTKDEEPIILHLPIKRLNLESVKFKKDLVLLKPKNYDKAFKKGKLILEKFKC